MIYGYKFAITYTSYNMILQIMYIHTVYIYIYYGIDHHIQRYLHLSVAVDQWTFHGCSMDVSSVSSVTRKGTFQLQELKHILG